MIGFLLMRLMLQWVYVHHESPSTVPLISVTAVPNMPDILFVTDANGVSIVLCESAAIDMCVSAVHACGGLQVDCISGLSMMFRHLQC